MVANPTEIVLSEEDAKLIADMQDEWLSCYEGSGKLYAIAMSAYDSGGRAAISFHKGEVVEILYYKPQQQWWFAASVPDRTSVGWVPGSLLKMMYDIRFGGAKLSSTDYNGLCQALISFRSYSQDELLFLKGEVILVEKYNPTGPWSYGRVGSRKGYFLNDLVVHGDSLSAIGGRNAALDKLVLKMKEQDDAFLENEAAVGRKAPAEAPSFVENEGKADAAPRDPSLSLMQEQLFTKDQTILSDEQGSSRRELSNDSDRISYSSYEDSQDHTFK